MTQQLQRRTETAISFRSLAESPAYKARIQEVLRDRAPQFVASLIQLVNASKQLQECDPATIMAAAMTAGALDLPIEKNLGFAHIVPYKNQAQFQMGYKGFIQLAIRTGQYRFLNACTVFEGELINCDKLTGQVVIDPTKKKSDKPIGYAAYFKLVNGYEHAEYWTVEEIESHARRYSQAYRSNYETPWKTDFDQMALKTVIKDLLSHWGILSVEMTRALSEDQAIRATVESDPVYPDAPEPQVSRPDFGGQPAALPAPSSPQSQPQTQEPTRRGRKPQPATTPPVEPAAAKPADDLSFENASPASQGAAAGVSTPPEQETPAVASAAQPVTASNPQGEGQELVDLREAMEAAGVNEGQTMAWAKSKRLAKPEQNHLSELATSKLASLLERWPDIVDQIRAMK